jgi:ABC-type Fe3+-hydroxamate transport system substrate-binding protein
VNRPGALIGTLIALVGCRAPAAPDATAFRDPEGGLVVIDSLPVTRIISTLQSATEWLVRLGAADLLVARTDFDREPELSHLPSLGGGLEISPEAVANLHPDVVLGWRIRSSVDMAHALRPFGIPVIAVEATDTAEVFDQLDAIGRLIGRQAAADSAATALRGELAELRRTACAPGQDPESVVIELWTDPPTTAGGTAWMSQLLGGACLVNIFDDLNAPWPAVSMESIAARQPHWVLTSRGRVAGQRLEELRQAPGWRDLDAVRIGRVLEVDPDLFSRAGVGLADWVRAVRTAKERLTTDR